MTFLLNLEEKIELCRFGLLISSYRTKTIFTCQENEKQRLSHEACKSTGKSVVLNKEVADVFSIGTPIIQGTE